MKSPRTRRNDHALSLFPFLAVLISTVGALVVLLVVVVQKARVDASQQAQLQQENARTQLNGRLDDLRWKSQMLQEAYDASVKQLAEARSRLSHLEDHIHRLKQQLAELQATAPAETDQVAPGRQQLQDELAELEEKIAQARRDVEQRRRELDEARTSYALLPYEGPRGTRRQPIYIECRADRVILQPEGLILTPRDFRSPVGPGNPLAAALRAKAEYLTIGGPDPSASQHGSPYPLLIVRPDGAEAYAACRAAMKDWQGEFGYELVEQDRELVFPPPDGELTRRLEIVLRDARRRHERLVALAAAEAAQRSLGGITAGPPNGLSPRNPLARRSPWAIDADISASGQSDGPDEFGSSTGPGTTGGPGGPGGPSATPGSGAPGFAGSSPGGPMSGRGPFEDRRAGEQPGGGVGPGQGRAAQGSHGSTAVASSSTSGGFGQYGTDSAEVPANLTAGPSRLGGDGLPHGAGRPQRSGSPRPGAGPSGFGGSSELAASPSGSSPIDHGATDANAPEGDLAAAPPIGSHSASSSAAGGSSGLRSSTFSTSPWDSDATSGSPTASAMLQARQLAETPMLAETRGRNWGLPSTSRGATGITRPIRIQIRKDTIALLPEAGTASTVQQYELGENSVEAVDRLVHDIWQRMEAWGMAGYGAFWRPVLVCQLDQHSELTFRRLAKLLEGSGITVQRGEL